jgi:hypothetical protein
LGSLADIVVPGRTLVGSPSLERLHGLGDEPLQFPLDLYRVFSPSTGWPQ